MKNIALIIALCCINIAMAQQSPTKTVPHADAKQKQHNMSVDNARSSDSTMSEKPEKLEEARQPGKNDPNVKGTGMTIDPVNTPQKLDATPTPAPAATPASQLAPKKNTCQPKDRSCKRVARSGLGCDLSQSLGNTSLRKRIFFLTSARFLYF